MLVVQVFFNPFMIKAQTVIFLKISLKVKLFPRIHHYLQVWIYDWPKTNQITELYYNIYVSPFSRDFLGGALLRNDHMANDPPPQ